MRRKGVNLVYDYGGYPGLLDGWILPNGDVVKTGSGGAREPHIVPFQEGVLPMPKGLEKYKDKLQDVIEWPMAIVEKGNYIRVIQSNFMTKDTSQGVLNRIENVMMDPKFTDYFEGARLIYVEPIKSGQSIQFSWRDFVENGLRIPKNQRWVQYASEPEAAGMLRVAVSRTSLEYMFDPAGQVAILSPKREKMPRSEQKSTMGLLTQDLQKDGKSWERGAGIYGGSKEVSVLVWDLPADRAFEYMAAYGQDAIIHKAKGDDRPYYYSQTAQSRYPALDLEFSEALGDRTEFRNDPGQKFTLNFDWDRPSFWALPGGLAAVWNRVRAGEAPAGISTLQKTSSGRR